MAFKINKPIGTDKGIVEGAYVRLGGYNISKTGDINFIIDIFENQEATQYETAQIPTIHPNKLQSKEIGISIDLKLTNRVEYTKTITKQVDGVDTEVEETFYKYVSDLSDFETKTIFEVGYEKLGEKLAETFGAENIEVV